MTEEKRNSSRKHDRVDFKASLKIRYPDFPKFLEKSSKDISEGGMFICSKNPKPPGTVLKFEIVEKGEARIIAGEGVVKWNRDFDPAKPELEPGMGVEFSKLTKESLALIRKIVEERSKGEPQAGGAAPEDRQKGKVRSDAETDKKPETSDIAEMIKDAQYEDKEKLDPIRTKGFFKEEVGKGQTGTARKGEAAPIVGIDLGTTNSCVAYVKGGKPLIIPSRKGYRTIPSIVALARGKEPIIGHDARAYLLTDPATTIYGSKRMLGRKFRSKAIEEIMGHFKYRMLEGEDGDVAVDIFDKTTPLIIISSLILKELKTIAEGHFAKPVTDAVITVPAYYSNRQRECVKEAGKLAGLNVKRIVNEPTAAALSYGLNKGLNEKILIYDLGGGTFDVSVMEISNNVFEVLASGGNSFLGGLDFDNRIAKYIVGEFKAKTGIDLSGNEQAMQRIIDAAEKAKTDLSVQSQTILNLPFICGDDNMRHDLVMEITREKLNQITQDLVNKTMQICQDVLRVKDIKRQDIDEIILVGGQTRMPLVSDTLTRIFGKPPKKGVHPDEVVAMGAALLADTFGRVDSVVLLDSLSIPIGVGLPGGKFKTIIPKNTRIPFEKIYSLTTTKDDQTTLEIDVYQGESDHLAECEYLGTFIFNEIPKAKKGECKLILSFGLSSECILHLKAQESLTGKSSEAQMVIKETPESVKKQLEKEKEPQ